MKPLWRFTYKITRHFCSKPPHIINIPQKPIQTQNIINFSPDILL